MIRLLILIISLYIIKRNYSLGRFISSSTIYLGCYLLIFVIYPSFQFDHKFIHESEIDIYALVGIIAFWLGSIIVKDNSRVPVRLNKYRTVSFASAFKIYWLVFSISAFMFITQVGLSRIGLVLSGSLTGKQLSFGEDAASTSYGYFTNLMIALVMVLCISAKTKKEVLFSYLTLSIYVAFTILFGFTRIFTISIIAMFVIYKIRHLRRKTQFIFATSGVFSLFLLLVSMNFIRCMGLGTGLDFEQIFDLGYMFESSDFGASYYWLNRLLDIDPPYIRIDTYLKPVLYLFIPRSIWPDKPEQTSMQILKILDPGLEKTGYSTAGYSVIGEGYAMIGYIGIFIFPLLWGIICTRLDIKYQRRLRSGYDNCIQNLFYYIFAIFIILCGQRGDWNQYLLFVIWFYMLPIYFLSKPIKSNR